jgi:ribonuclease P protein component
VAKETSEEFPHEVRIVRSSDYRMLYKSGSKIYSEKFVLFWRENKIGHHRLGITVSRKVGNSVVRNRVKRLLREIFRKSFRRIPGQADILVNVKSGCAGANYLGLQAEFLAAARRIGHY